MICFLIFLPFYLRMGLLGQWQRCKLQVTLRQLWEVQFVEMACYQRKMLSYSVQYSEIFSTLNFAGSLFDPLGQARGPAPPLEMKNPDRLVQFCSWFQSIKSTKSSWQQSLETYMQLWNLERPNLTWWNRATDIYLHGHLTLWSSCTDLKESLLSEISGSNCS